MINPEILLNLPDLECIEFRRVHAGVIVSARYTGRSQCPHCDSTHLRNKGKFLRRVRHPAADRKCWVEIEAHRWLCRDCGRQFRQRLPGILPYQQSSEAFRRWIYGMHRDGFNRSCVARRESIGAATVQRHFQHGLELQYKQWHSLQCPSVLGIDEHFFSRRDGYATTFCDLVHHKVYDVVLGRSESDLKAYLQALQGRDRVRMVCIDLSPSYRALVQQYFPNAIVVADRFHVIRVVNYHLLACWRELEPKDSTHRGLRKLMRYHQRNLKPEQWSRLENYLAQHPMMETIYDFKQRLCRMLSIKHRTKKQCRKLIQRFLIAIHQLKQSGLAALVKLGETLDRWQQEIAAMWRFTRNNGITEGFHTKMELISRQAYGYRNFENYKMRVKVLCA